MFPPSDFEVLASAPHFHMTTEQYVFSVCTELEFTTNEFQPPL